MKILIVDDNLELAELLAGFLEDLGHRTIVYYSATDALTYSDSNSFDAIISDFHMPEMNGLEFYAALQDKYLRIPPFIIISGDIAKTQKALEQSHASIHALFEKSQYPELEKCLASILENTSKTMAKGH